MPFSSCRPIRCDTFQAWPRKGVLVCLHFEGGFKVENPPRKMCRFWILADLLKLMQGFSNDLDEDFFFKSLEWLSDFLVCFWCWYFLSFYWKLKILSYCWFQQVFFGFFAALLVSKSHQYPASSVDRPFVACIQLESKGCHFTKHHALKWWHLLHLKTNRRCIKNMILGIKQVIFADDDWVSTSPKRKRIVFRFHETILSFGELLDP